MNRLPVVAAVPNYNMGQQLETLLPQLAAQNYEAIYVLDDASTDGSRELIEGLDLDVNFVQAPENKGAGAARNLIIGQLPSRALVHFVDADSKLLSESSPELIQDIMPSEPIGFLGGLSVTEAGVQHTWNYGPRHCLRTNIGSRVHALSARLAESDPDKAKFIRDRFSSLLSDWPDPFGTPVRRPIFWAIEQNFVVDSEVFEGVGGFDESLREHEIQDIALRMHAKGLERIFDPSLAIEHKTIDVRLYNRSRKMALTRVRIIQEHGLRDWVMPDGHWKPAL